MTISVARRYRIRLTGLSLPDHIPARTRRAFTTLELVTVVAVILILAALLWPVINRARRLAQRTSCLSHLRGVGQAVLMYRQDYGELPPRLSSLVPTYTADRRLLVCLADPRRGRHAAAGNMEGDSFLHEGVSYQYFPSWHRAWEYGWYEPAPNFGPGKWEDLTPLAACPWHWAGYFTTDISDNVPGSSGWEIILTVGGSIRKRRVEESLRDFTPQHYH